MIELGNLSITLQIIFVFFFGLILLTIIITFVLPGALGLKKTIEGIYIGRLVREAVWFKRYRLFIGIVAITLVVVSVGSYVFYLQGRPQIITASQFREREEDSINYIQRSEDYFIIKNSEMYILDIRGEEEYTQEHIKGAFSLPLDKIKEGFSFSKDKKIAVYTDGDKFWQARQAADIINDQVDEKVYVVDGGFEGLKSERLETAEGAPFGGE